MTYEMPRYIYLVQHTNGYVHCVLDSHSAALKFVHELNVRGIYDYNIIERQLHTHFSEIGR